MQMQTTFPQVDSPAQLPSKISRGSLATSSNISTGATITKFCDSRKNKQAKLDAVLLLRYHTLKPAKLFNEAQKSSSMEGKISNVYASYADIARLVKMPYSTVRRRCISAIQTR